ncbi:DNA polymerase IV [Nitriliruptoraceae bacterium ZYF776]|nr:DNA polymerase IV [Profundirhabdus halotolerans]
MAWTATATWSGVAVIGTDGSLRVQAAAPRGGLVGRRQGRQGPGRAPRPRPVHRDHPGATIANARSNVRRRCRVTAPDPEPASPADAVGAREPILHVDMDAFFASVEQRDDPDLRGRPVVVGGAGGRGVVAAASYEARRFGIRSAMPMVQARRRCPDLVIAPHRFEVYRDVSRAVMAILQDVTPAVEPLSVDEAFLDVRGAIRLFGSPVTIGASIRRRIRDELDLPCSVGVGPTKSVAKLLSAKAKPDGLLHWPADEVVARLRPLPVSDLWGAGPRTVERLETYGFRTVGQLADTDLRTLQRVVGDAAGAHLHALANGRDPRSVTPHEPARSISAETTFDVDVDDPDQLDRVLLRLGEKVGRRLRHAEVAGRTVTLKVRFASFETVTRSRTLAEATDRTHDVVGAARALLAGLRLERARVRLLGVGVSNLADGDAARQLALDAPAAAAAPWSDHRWEDVDRVADEVAERFRDVGVSFASLLDDDDREGPWASREDVDDVRPHRDPG